MKRTIFEPEHDQFRDSVRAFLTKEAVPHTEKWEAQGLVDREFWSLAAAQGFVGFSAPEEFGGAGSATSGSTRSSMKRSSAPEQSAMASR